MVNVKLQMTRHVVKVYFLLNKGGVEGPPKGPQKRTSIHYMRTMMDEMRNVQKIDLLGLADCEQIFTYITSSEVTSAIASYS